MQVTKGTRRMHKHCVPGSVSSSPTQELGNEAITDCNYTAYTEPISAEEQKGSGLQDYPMVAK